MLENRWT